MKEKVNEFTKGFSKIWFVGVTVLPWALFSMYLMILSRTIGSLIFSFVFSMGGIFGIIYLVYIVLVKQKKYELSPTKSFILNKSTKLFWAGIICTYALSFLFLIISPFLAIFLIFGSLVVVIPLIIFYYLGKKKYQEFQKQFSK